MKEAFSYVRPACDFAGVLSDEASVGVVNGRLEAYNKELSISIPVDMPDFAVPAADFDFAMRKHEDPSIKVTEKSVMLAGKTRVRRLADRHALKRPEVETNAVTNVGDLLEVIDEIFAFTAGDPARPWAEGARFDQTTVTATNSVMLIQAELHADSGLEGVTVSRAALAYIRLRRAALKAWTWTERGLLIDFDDGSWCLAARLAMEMPDQAVNLLQVIDNWDDMQDVTTDYKASIMRAGEWADDVLTLRPSEIHAGRLSTDHTESVITTLSGEEAVFAASDLVTVVSKAERIAFDRYPKPCPFITARGSKGLIAGRS